MNEKARPAPEGKDPVAIIVGLAAAAFVVGMVFLLLNGGVTPRLVLWSSASIGIAAFGGGFIYVATALLRGY